MKRFERTERVSEEIKRELSQIIQRELKDPRLAVGMVSVTRVELTRDLKNANIYISVFGADEKIDDIMAALVHSAGFMRSQIGKRMRIRTTPELFFKLDDSIEYAARIHKILINDVADDLHHEEGESGESNEPAKKDQDID